MAIRSLALSRAALRPLAQRVGPQPFMAIRSASSAVAAQTEKPQVVPTEDELAADPQLAGLGYPQLPQISRQMRPAKAGWWDEQERMNYGETLPENDDTLSMWAPDVHTVVSGGKAIRHLSMAAAAIASFVGLLYLVGTEVPAAKRKYPYDGLVKELSGTDDQAYAAVMKGSGKMADEEEEDEE